MAITLSITGMTCGHCVRSVTKALEQVEGVDKVAVSLDDGQARVDGRAAPQALVRAINDEGYVAEVLASQ